MNETSFEKVVEEGLTWIRTHQERFWTVVGIVVMVFLFGFFAVQQHQRQQTEAWTQLGAVQGSLLNGQYDAAAKALTEWTKKYGASNATTYAKFLQADLLSKTGHHAESAKTYAEIAATGRPAVTQPLGLSAEISEEESAGQIPQARATAQRFIDKYPDHFFAATAYMSQARLAEISGDMPEAQRIYERFVVLYPQSPWTAAIRDRLQKMPPSSPITPLEK